MWIGKDSNIMSYTW